MDIFKYVDEAVEFYRKIEYKYVETARQLKKMLEELVVANSEFTLSVSYRVKEPDSIREKLIRNSYYRFNTTKQEILANVQDIIGLRIECKFTEDESYVFSLFKKLFPKTDDEIYYYNEDYSKMRFKLSEQQPVKQKNGFDIYKIDGRYEDKEEGRDTRINFEVQIKSMVNMFWGDIEHKIIYKNPSYFMVEQQVIETMTTIKENLNLVDRQLHKLYKRYKREDNSKMNYRKENIESILSKLIYDTFARKMKNELGFVVQFKETCDSIVEYIFVVNNAAQMEDYGRVMMDMFYLTGNIAKEEISYRAPLVFEKNLSTDDVFIDTMFTTIQKMINSDFNWHLYFVILFELERGDHTDNMENFLRYYKGRLAANAGVTRLEDVFPREQAKLIRTDLMTEMGYVFRRHADIELLYKEGIEALTTPLYETVSWIVEEAGDWEKERSKYFIYLNNSIQKEVGKL